MKKYAIVFPGQGTQKPGMGKSLYENSEAAKKVFDTANEVLGYDLADICFNGSEEDLLQTKISQPAILTVSIAAYEALKEKCDVNVACFAGHSLGESAALYAAGVVDLKTVLFLISQRAILMNESASNSTGSMAAVLGLDDETVIKLTEQMNNVYVANFNSPGQVVITGDKEEIEKNLDTFKQAGAKRVIPLAVSGAFHSPYMKEAGEKFAKNIEESTFNDAKLPVYTNVDASATTDAREFQDKLSKQVYSSVQWTETVKNITKEGITNFIEVGPGKVLSGLNKKINPETNTLNIFDYESLMQVVSEIKEKELV